MASYYRKIDIRIQGDEKFRSLSRPQPNGQYLFIHLLTNPHTTNIPGIFRASLAILADDLKWETGSLREAFAEITDRGMAVADEDARVVYVPNAIRYNPPASVNVIKSWVTALDLVPESHLKAMWVKRVWSFLCNEFRPVRGDGQTYIDAFRDAFAVAYPEAFAKPSGSLLEGFAYQDQDQDQKEKKGTPELHREGGVGDNSPDIPNSKNEPGSGSGFSPPPPDEADSPPAKTPRRANGGSTQLQYDLVRQLAIERGIPWHQVIERAGGPPPWPNATVTSLVKRLKSLPKLSDADADLKRRDRRTRDARGDPDGGPRHIGDVIDELNLDPDDPEDQEDSP